MVKQLDNSNAIKLYSFDVFDTCITRKVAQPTDLFFDIPEQASLGKTEFSEKQILEAYRLRVEAEKEARAQNRFKQDILLKDIYKIFHPRFINLTGLEISFQRLMDIECQLEINSTKAILATLRKVQSLHQTGSRIIYVSDMYLPSSVIAQLLDKCGFPLTSTTIYVSGELGITKHSGDLYNYIIQQEKVLPSSILHTGDNPYSDIKQAKKRGIRTSFINQPGTHKYQENYKKNSLTNRFYSREVFGISNTIYQHFYEDQENALNAIISYVAAPLLCCYVSWVLNEAKKAGITRLYFVARNGFIMYEIAKLLNRNYGLELRYLYGSRQAWFLPSINKISDDLKKLLFAEGKSKSIQDILARLSIDIDEVSPILESLGYRGNFTKQLDKASLEHFWSALKNSKLADEILERAENSRKSVISYLEAEGLFENVSWALVDIGWVLNCQKALKMILETKQPDISVKGYYFGVGATHVNIEEVGEFYSYFLEPAMKSQRIPWAFNLATVMLVEDFFTAALHGSTQGYSDDNPAKPITVETELSEKNLAYIKACHEIIVQFAKQMSYEQTAHFSKKECAWANLSQLSLLSNYPSYTEAQSISSLTANDEQSHSSKHIRPFVSPLGILDIIEIVGATLLSKNHKYNKFIWFEGSLSLSPAFIRLILKFLLAIRNKTKKSKK